MKRDIQNLVHSSLFISHTILGNDQKRTRVHRGLQRSMKLGTKKTGKNQLSDYGGFLKWKKPSLQSKVQVVRRIFSLFHGHLTTSEKHIGTYPQVMSRHSIRTCIQNQPLFSDYLRHSPKKNFFFLLVKMTRALCTQNL